MRALILFLAMTASPAAAEIMLRGEAAMGVTSSARGSAIAATTDLTATFTTRTEGGTTFGAEIGIGGRRGVEDCFDGGVHRGGCFPGVPSRTTRSAPGAPTLSVETGN